MDNHRIRVVVAWKPGDCRDQWGRVIDVGCQCCPKPLSSDTNTRGQERLSKSPAHPTHYSSIYTSFQAFHLHFQPIIYIRFPYNIALSSTCTLCLHTALPTRHICVQTPCHGSQSSRGLQYDCTVGLDKLHHIAAKDYPPCLIPHSRPRESGERSDTHSPLDAWAQSRTFFDNGSWPVRLRLRGTLYHTAAMSLALQDVRASCRIFSSLLSWPLHM